MHGSGSSSSPVRRAGLSARGSWLVAGAGVVLAGIVVRVTSLPGPPCVFRLWSGHPCPGCGSTRAVRALVHFDVLTAFSLNPLFTVAAFGFLGWAVRRAGADFGWWSRPNPSPRRSGSRWLLPVLIIALLGNWAYILWLEHG